MLLPLLLQLLLPLIPSFEKMDEAATGAKAASDSNRKISGI